MQKPPQLSAREKLSKRSYSLAKKIIFRFDSEKAHDFFVNAGESLGSSKLAKSSISKLLNFQHSSLKQNILGINFRNPVGLAAGFDYDGRLTQILPDLGFGFETIGSITLKPYAGNPPPRLGRLIKSKSLLVNKGLKNSSTSELIAKLSKKKFQFPLGISVAKTNCKETANDEAAIKDYASSLNLLKKSNIGDFYELNISCPNAFGGETFTTPKKLSVLLKKIDSLKLQKPLFLKMPVDFSEKETDALCNAASKYNVQGLIFGNLTKNRKNPSFNKEEIANATKGNFSGIPTQNLSNNLIRFAYKNYSSRFIIIGCGGIFSAEDAYKKIKLGASLVQLITGMIYEGPSIISEINHGLVQLLERDGFSNISEAIGTDNK